MIFRFGYFTAAIQFWIMAWSSAEAKSAFSTLLFLLLAVILFVKATPA